MNLVVLYLLFFFLESLKTSLATSGSSLENAALIASPYNIHEFRMKTNVDASYKMSTHSSILCHGVAISTSHDMK